MLKLKRVFAASVLLSLVLGLPEAGGPVARCLRRLGGRDGPGAGDLGSATPCCKETLVELEEEASPRNVVRATPDICCNIERRL